tara:strand:- start:1329 stop:1763 length:435 start_codon:yes stop_codon:yes gene_type:complete
MTGYQVLKLMSGDDVICNVVSDIENKLKISDPLKMDTVNRFTKKGLVESLALSRWIQPYSDEDFFYLDKSSVILMAPASIGLSKYYEYVLKTLDRVILKDNKESFTEKIQPKETEDNIIIDDDVEENELLEQMADTLNTKRTVH